ncbi:ABC transporter permease [Pseudoclavibacter endophyticus]|uniref:ABC transporter permease n=1 Tax=Pseudoclavibacter endophyticus TaxID=1778590 RepID=A0A6H9WHD8_9MICO|nr:ABC transporter permease [Pseudoclavibacter endophyticus]KAB1650369.1 ABC transporter permease [Pseudoclavibacter endophyticus]GGA54741.1 ABC transporter permease [Pseudoclavibacter endophyticus]
MVTFIARRIGAAVTLLLAVTFIAFMLLYPAAGNIAANILGENATQEQVALKNEQLGLDRPLLVQYGDWLAHAFTGDLGQSYFTSQPVWTTLAARLPITLSLVALVMILTGVLAFTLGTLAAVRRGWIDRTVQLLSTLGDALPHFIIGLFLVTVFALQLGWFPATGYTPLETSPGLWALGLTLPVVALTVGGVAGVVQQVRSATLGVLQNDYIRTLRSRGLSETRIVLTSVLRNASTNGLTSLAVQVVGILGGAVVIEQVFALPGLGSLAVESTSRTDLPVVIGVVLAAVVIVVTVNLLVDIAVAALNPKVRLS